MTTSSMLHTFRPLTLITLVWFLPKMYRKLSKQQSCDILGSKWSDIYIAGLLMLTFKVQMNIKYKIVKLSNFSLFCYFQFLSNLINVCSSPPVSNQSAGAQIARTLLGGTASQSAGRVLVTGHCFNTRWEISLKSKFVRFFIQKTLFITPLLFSSFFNLTKETTPSCFLFRDSQ